MILKAPIWRPDRALILCRHLPTYEGDRRDAQRILIGLGLVILVTGIMWPVLLRIGLGRLPGGIMFRVAGPRSIFLWSPASSV
jgi:hypothetical protein